MTILENIQLSCQENIDQLDVLIDEFGNLENPVLTDLYRESIVNCTNYVQSLRKLIDFYYGIENTHKRPQEVK